MMSQLKFSVLRLAWRVRLAWARSRGRATSLDMSRLTGFYEGIWRKAVGALSAEMTEVSNGIWRVRRGACATLIQNYVLQIDDPVTLHVGGDKVLCHRLLSATGLRIPDYLEFRLQEFESAERFMQRHTGAHFVVKPAAGTSGARGVTTLVASARECRIAAALASLYCDRILIERWIPGECYRLLILDGELIHASRRKGLWVVGDGGSTIHSLVTNQRGPMKERRARRDRMDRDMRATLSEQGLRLDSVLDKGRKVLVQSALGPSSRRAEVRTVFDQDATREIGDGLRHQAALAARTIGSRFAGVDIITCNPDASLEHSGGVVNEINTTPGLHHHYNLDGASSGDDPATRVLAHLLGASASATSPSHLTTANIDPAPVPTYPGVRHDRVFER